MLDFASNLANTIQESVEPLLTDSSLISFIKSSVEKINQSDRPYLLVFSFPFDAVDPLQLLDIQSKSNGFQYYWEQPGLNISITAGDELIRLQEDGKDRFRKLSNLISHWKTYSLEYSPVDSNMSGLTFLGGFSFFDHPKSEHWKPFGSGMFIIPGWMYVRNIDNHILTLTLKTGPGTSESTVLKELTDKIKSFSQITSTGHFAESETPLEFDQAKDSEALEKWTNSVIRATDSIKKGDFEKIVLARKVSLEANRRISPYQLLHNLKEHYPTSYCFLIRHNADSVFVGCSPERLASFQSNFVLTEGLAGSISRGQDSEEDNHFERKLLSSIKDLQEHRYVVEAIINRLKAFTEQIDYPEVPGIRKFENVQHLYTPITAWLKNRIDPLMILEQLHPTPAVGGTPRHKAISHIRELEHFERGWYAGPIGWCNSRGRGEFSVAIRSGLLNGKKAEFYAGCGIVKDSVPDQEWEETNLKLIPMLSAIKHA